MVRVLGAWNEVLAKENQAVLCRPHAPRQGWGLGPCYPFLCTQDAPYTWGSTTHVRLHQSHTLLTHTEKHYSGSSSLPGLSFWSTELTKLQQGLAFSIPAPSSQVEATWRPGKHERGGKVGRTWEI